MSLTPGTRLGSYEVVSPLGEGGMGEVYRARDTKLDRDVALKILPESFASDPDRLMRFEREAKTLAALNHPNIAAIYGIEESGSRPEVQGAGGPEVQESGSTRALVMELVEGEDLSAIIARGPVPLDDAVAIARQIADALEAAHEQGIIHRDLKPANVKVRPDGTVKVLDFGLAKAMDLGTSGPLDPANSPTLTAGPTHIGMILGTAAYMAPEQARGKPVDKRADIWAFGVVLYEMLSGQRAFRGEDVTDTIVSVVGKDANWTALPSSTPVPVRSLLRRCLDKDPRRRLRDIGECRIALEGGNPAPPPDMRRTGALVWTASAVAVVSLVVAALALWNRPAVERTTARLTIALPPDAELTSYPAISRDGRTVAYVAQQGSGDSQLFLRDLNAFDPVTVPGSSGAKQPFFSPDGTWVAFFAQGQLLKAEVAGGTPIRLAEAAYAFGGTWNDDDTIIYAGSLSSGLLRIPAAGGAPALLTKPDGAALGYAHVFPQSLPGGRSILFTTWGQAQGAAVLSLESGLWEVVLPQAGSAVATFQSSGGSAGHVLLIDEAAGIRAAPLDAANPGPTSADTLVLSDVYYEAEVESLGWLAVSNTGTAVYASGNPARTTLVNVDREGRSEPLVTDQGVYREASLSPSGRQAVVRQASELWVYDLERATRSRLATGANLLPLWSRDGKRIVFASNQGGDWDIYTQPSDGSGPSAVLLERPYDQFPLSTLADGTLLFLDIQPATGRDVWTLSPAGKASALRVTPYNETQAQVSPGPIGGSRRVAYESDESGRFEIYVQSYPAGSDRIPVSPGGGILPRWSGDGRELYYVAEDAMVAVPVRPDGSFGAPRRLFDRSPFLFNHRFNSYSVSPDGTRFLMIRRDPGSVPRQLNVVLNWSDAVGRLVSESAR